MGAPTLPILSNSIAGSLQIPAYYHARCVRAATAYFYTMPSVQDDGGYFLAGQDTSSPSILLAYYNNAGARIWYTTDLTAMLSTASGSPKLIGLTNGDYYGVIAGTSANIAIFKLSSPYVNATMTKIGQYALNTSLASNARSLSLCEMPNGNIKIIYQSNTNALRYFVVSTAGTVIVADTDYNYSGITYAPPILNVNTTIYETSNGIIVSGIDSTGVATLIHKARIAFVTIPFVGSNQQVFTHSGYIHLTAKLSSEQINNAGSGFVRSDFDAYIYNLAYNLGLLRL